MSSTTVPATSPKPRHALGVDALVANARRAMRRGQWQRAYQLSLEATRREPENSEACLMRFQTAVSAEERLFSLSQVNRIDPHHPEARNYLS